MHSNNDYFEEAARREAIRAPGAATQCFTLGSASKTEAHQLPDFGSILLAIAGHDLRQPLQAIQSTHDLLGLGIRTKSELRLLRSGQQAIDRLTAQLDQLLAALRLRDPEGVKLMPLQLAHVLHQIACENEFEALRKGIKLSVIRSSASIRSDKLLFGAILRNLVRNAVKYTDPGGRVIVGCRCTGDSVSIEVHDTGVGIPADEMPRIFDLFSCVGSRSGEDHGVGLFIVRQAIGLLGHRLEITSAPSQGSRFCIIARRG